MKKVSIYLSVLLLGISSATLAQETTGQEIKKDAKKAGKAVKKTAKKAGDKTAELGVKGVSKIADKTVQGKTAANGETVYITSDSRYYYVDKKGARHFVTAAQLKDKM